MSVQPHSSWANVYDLAYQRSFGDFYNHLTDATVAIIEGIIRPPANIVDFGAGTGRLSIPLAQKGYDVTAVDPCQEMLNQLQQKIQQGKIRAVCSRMEDFRSKREFDVALCVFTVLLYLLDEDSLRRAFESAHASLKLGGILIIDIPYKAIFRGYSRRDPMIERTVSVIKQADNIFNYRENLVVKRENGEASEYQDEFLIRYWPQEQVMETLKDRGFVQEKDLSDNFSGTGSNYYIMKKAEQGPPPDGR
jgi:SAM-dependent methyltransferase